VAADVDLDGAVEYLLYNNRVFAVFEASGGRMTAAWLRDPSTKKVWQVAGNFASYSGTDSEGEGESNVTVTTNGMTLVNAYRTSGFKDWWAVTGGSGSNNSVNSTYNVVPANNGTGWTFSRLGGVTKTITLPNHWSGNLSAAYELNGPNELYVRFGLSPNLLDLMTNGQANLQTPEASAVRFNLVNSSAADGPVRAFVQTSTGSAINMGATDKATNFSSVNMRNQAQTHQVEVQVTNNTVITLGFDQGAEITGPDAGVTDGIPDSWWEKNNITSANRVAAADPDADGLTNMQEYVLDSNPNNAASGRPIVGVGQISGGFRLSFSTALGRNYQVQVRNEISSGAWTNLGEVIAGNGDTKTYDDLTALQRRFYRVVVSVADGAMNEQ